MTFISSINETLNTAYEFSHKHLADSTDPINPATVVSLAGIALSSLGFLASSYQLYRICIFKVESDHVTALKIGMGVYSVLFAGSLVLWINRNNL